MVVLLLMARDTLGIRSERRFTIDIATKMNAAHLAQTRGGIFFQVQISYLSILQSKATVSVFAGDQSQ